VWLAPRAYPIFGAVTPETRVDNTLKPTKRAWSTPTLRHYHLTEEELGRLRKSGDPMRELLTMKPELVKDRRR